MWSELKFWKEQHPYIRDFLKEEKEKGKKILPYSSDILNAFIYTRRGNVKVVILGQDPYPNRAYAMGLAFSVPENSPQIPASLQNIYKELKDDLGVERTNGSLLDWAKQGVLLLNTSLTVEEGKPNSHSYIGWHELVKEVIETLSTEQDGLVFILWGANAHAYEQYIKCPKRHMIIRSAHPSPLSAHKGFFGSKPFSKTNFFLESVGKEPIKW